MTDDENSIHIAARDVPFDAYTALLELKKRGKFPNWGEFFGWLGEWVTNDLSFKHTMREKINQRLKELEKEKTS